MESTADRFCHPRYGWRNDGTCEYCGSLRPSRFLELVKNGEKVGPTDKAYKMYVLGTQKVYTEHFSKEQALELIELIETGKVNIDYPGRFYSGLAFGEFKDDIAALMARIAKENTKPFDPFNL